MVRDWFQNRLVNIAEIYDGIIGLFSLGLFRSGLAFRLVIYFQTKKAMKSAKAKRKNVVTP